MKRYVIGDIHGAHKALIQCLERSNFNKDEDLLITLGDIVDGWTEVYECVEELLTIKNRIDIKGNHDDWFKDYYLFGEHPTGWRQGGDGTLKSYRRTLIEQDINFSAKTIPQTHKDFFNNQRLYYKDPQNNVFVHGGFNRSEYLDYLEHFFPEDFYWNRDLWKEALSATKHQKLRFTEEINKVFIGHTSTCSQDKTLNPVFTGGVWNLDQGAGWFGKLTILDIDSEEYWQSDRTEDLYPDEKGRRG